MRDSLLFVLLADVLRCGHEREVFVFCFLLLFLLLLLLSCGGGGQGCHAVRRTVGWFLLSWTEINKFDKNQRLSPKQNKECNRHQGIYIHASPLAPPRELETRNLTDDVILMSTREGGGEGEGVELRGYFEEGWGYCLVVFVDARRNEGGGRTGRGGLDGGLGVCVCV